MAQPGVQIMGVAQIRMDMEGGPKNHSPPLSLPPQNQHEDDGEELSSAAAQGSRTNLTQDLEATFGSVSVRSNEVKFTNNIFPTH